ncbi:MAG: hypothetical protein FJX76_02960 [Armatimonadetes bacterium]|nr:hypothetical protein [Armatimonadota bacterium]
MNMRSLVTAGLAFLLVAAPTASFAETTAQPAVIAQNPNIDPTVSAAPQQTQKAKTIWDYSKELNLTDKQTTDMKAAFADLQTSVKSKAPQLQTLAKQLNDLLKSEAPLEQIKPKLAEIYAIRLDLHMADIATARKINAIMTKDQLAKWREIQQKNRKG